MCHSMIVVVVVVCVQALCASNTHRLLNGFAIFATDIVSGAHKIAIK